MADNKSTYDLTFLHARREALIIFTVWMLALFWAVPYCYFNGYGLNPAELENGVGCALLGVLGDRRAVGSGQYLHLLVLPVLYGG